MSTPKQLRQIYSAMLFLGRPDNYISASGSMFLSLLQDNYIYTISYSPNGGMYIFTINSQYVTVGHESDILKALDSLHKGLVVEPSNMTYILHRHTLIPVWRP